jgi:hypothetical protein
MKVRVVTRRDDMETIMGRELVRKEWQWEKAERDASGPLQQVNLTAPKGRGQGQFHAGPHQTQGEDPLWC